MGTGFMGKNEEVSFGHVEFEMNIRHSNEDNVY